MAGLGKQAKILTDKQIALVLAAVAARRYPLRDRVIILLSVRAYIEGSSDAKRRIVDLNS